MPAGDPRRWKDACTLAGSGRADDDVGGLRRASRDRRAGRAERRRHDRRAPVELRRRGAETPRDGPRARDRLARVGRRARAAAGRRRTRKTSSPLLGLPFVPPELREAADSAHRRRSSSVARHPRRPSLPHDVVGREGARARDGDGGPRPRLRVPRDLRPHAERRGRSRSRRRRASPPGRGDRRRERAARAVPRSSAAPSATSAPTARSTCPTTSSPSSSGCSSRSTPASARRARELTARVAEAMRHPAVRCLSHPTGRLIGHRPENALDLERTIEVALETGVALEVNGLAEPARPERRARARGDRGRRARSSCSTDAHSIGGLGEHGPLRPHRAARRRETRRTSSTPNRYHTSEQSMVATRAAPLRLSRRSSAGAPVIALPILQEQARHSAEIGRLLLDRVKVLARHDRHHPFQQVANAATGELGAGGTNGWPWWLEVPPKDDHRLHRRGELPARLRSGLAEHHQQAFQGCRSRQPLRRRSTTLAQASPALSRSGPCSGGGWVFLPRQYSWDASGG